jgi:hypothetical protein
MSDVCACAGVWLSADVVVYSGNTQVVAPCRRGIKQVAKISFLHAQKRVRMDATPEEMVFPTTFKPIAFMHLSVTEHLERDLVTW